MSIVALVTRELTLLKRGFMKFSKSVVVIAVTMFAINATAQTAVQAPSANSVQPVTVQPTGTPAAAAPTVGAAPVVAPAPVPTAATAVPAPKVDPKVDSRAEELRKSRQEAELKNDDKLVEKLEKARLEEEKVRAEKIDNAALNSQQAPAAPVEAAKKSEPTVTIQRVEIIQPESKQVEIKDEKPSDAKSDAKAEAKQDKWYAGAGLGSISYGTNVNNKSSYEFTVGTKIEDRLMVEATFAMASFDLSRYLPYGLFSSMEQYDFGVAAKYILSDTGKFQPFIGASADYLYREYKNRYDSGLYYQNYDNYTTGQNTEAMNLGMIVGADFKIVSNVLVGGQFKYSMNVYNQNRGLVSSQAIIGNTKPIEEQSFSSFLISAKYLF
jgi:outer membrane protein W